ncbi:MAG: uncharacterized protein QOE19_3709 [Actinomycetota bacterium]|jgi:hypothetical protein|nr:uncharacterized protein [Actinomycetota bacterium]
MACSTANVTTATPGRYAKQLASHLGRRAKLVSEAEGERIVVGDGSCLLVLTENQLVLKATAQDDLTLARVKDVVGGHLARFGSRDGLLVNWVDHD